jgi:hypothetical protein
MHLSNRRRDGQPPFSLMPSLEILACDVDPYLHALPWPSVKEVNFDSGALKDFCHVAEIFQVWCYDGGFCYGAEILHPQFWKSSGVGTFTELNLASDDEFEPGYGVIEVVLILAAFGGQALSKLSLMYVEEMTVHILEWIFMTNPRCWMEISKKCLAIS